MRAFVYVQAPPPALKQCAAVVVENLDVAVNIPSFLFLKGFQRAPFEVVPIRYSIPYSLIDLKFI